MLRQTLMLAGLPVALAAQAPPATEIYLAPMTVSRTRATIGAPVNITNRPGYDNQPTFTPDGRTILFTSIRGDGQADIYRYDIEMQLERRVTTTPESEYSPIVSADSKRFSVIRVERDSTQRVWSFAMDGSDPQLVLPAIKPVGYHAWIDDHRLALFVLGRPSLVIVADTRSPVTDTLARDVGRSVAALPGRAGFSYVRRNPADTTFTLVRVSSRARKADATDIDKLPKGAEFVVWLAGGGPMTASDTKIYQRDSGRKEWAQIADFKAAGIKNITRMAISPDRRWIAFVAEPAGPATSP